MISFCAIVVQCVCENFAQNCAPFALASANLRKNGEFDFAWILILWWGGGLSNLDNYFNPYFCHFQVLLYNFVYNDKSKYQAVFFLHIRPFLGSSGSFPDQTCHNPSNIHFFILNPLQTNQEEKLKFNWHYCYDFVTPLLL